MYATLELAWDLDDCTFYKISVKKIARGILNIASIINGNAGKVSYSRSVNELLVGVKTLLIYCCTCVKPLFVSSVHQTTIIPEKRSVYHLLLSQSVVIFGCLLLCTNDSKNNNYYLNKSC